ncbi:hypothetical protein [Sphingobacterium sp.]|uniref:hypothetical protein n=1 Tax=Sphingobacterium sp. TaxID=341027 RepID=UPI0031D0F22E
MTAAIAVSVLLLITFYFLVSKKQLEKRFNRSVGMTVNYMFQDRPGQYSGDRNVKSGVFVFKAERNDDKLKNIVIRKVRPLHTALDVSLEQILVIPFEPQDKRNADVSVRFKVIKRGAKLEDLKGEKVSISGMLNFSSGRPEAFSVVLQLADIYKGSETGAAKSN